MSKDNFLPHHLDVLREIGTIGAGRAATALAEMLHVKVEISVSETATIPLNEIGRILGNPEEASYAIDVGLEGDIDGRILFIFPPREAKVLGSILLGKEPKEIDFEDNMFMSSLKEIYNILVGSYMIALSELTGLTILYTVPSLVLDMVSAILDIISVQIAQYSEEAILIKTNLTVQNIDFKGILLFFPNTASLERIFGILGIKD